MGPSRIQRTLNEAGMGIALQNMEACPCFSALFSDRHLLPIPRITADRRIDQTIIIPQYTFHNRLVFSMAGLILQLEGDGAMRKIVLARDQASGRILINSMHNTYSI